LDSTDWFCFGILWLVPVAISLWWIRMRLGIDRRWFVIPAAPLISRNIYFFLPAFIPSVVLGLIGVLSVAIDPTTDDNPIYFTFYLAFGFQALGFVIAYLEPSWLSPTWYRWLKKEHGDILPYLAQEAHEMGRRKWLKQVKTQAGLEQWVEDFRRRHHLEKISASPQEIRTTD
jgi:hypothetical protein